MRDRLTMGMKSRFVVAGIAGLIAAVLVVVLLSTVALEGSALTITTAMSVVLLGAALIAICFAIYRGQRFNAGADEHAAHVPKSERRS